MKPVHLIGVAVPACLLGVLIGRWMHPEGEARSSTRGLPRTANSSERGAASIRTGETEAQEESRSSAGKSIAEMSDDELRLTVESALKEKNHLKRFGQFSMLLAGTDQAGLARISGALAGCYKKGWDTMEFGEMTTAREGELLGEEGMTGIPKEPNGTPSFQIKSRMRGWASADPAAGLQWLERLEPGKVKDNLTDVWLQGAKLADSAKILELLPALPEGRFTEALAGRVVEGALLERGRDGMAEWFTGISASVPESVKVRMYRRMVDSFTQNPSEAFQTVDILKQIDQPDGQLFATGVLQMTWRTARYNPERTLDLLNEYGPQNEFLAENRGKVIRDCIVGSSTNTIDTIGNWLNGHQDSPYYNEVVGQFFDQITPLDPDGAKAWASSVKDEALRTELLSRLGEGESESP